MNGPQKNRPQCRLGSPTALFRCSSYCKPAPFTVNSAPPTVNLAPLTVNSAPPTVNSAPPNINSAPPTVNSAPPTVQVFLKVLPVNNLFLVLFFIRLPIFLFQYNYLVKPR